ncbi:hypothetical protein [Frateuria sp. STR12]|uniref:hypothetical protein n=1 Tax=Frateuria hangzhouensis TaxID=2995589 RepID=UPI002260EC7C|nr:hypothetical protein [Frateuria sp. STR12]MCX7515061.1 hypothetical protein [Frateuria sp. STR12]
MLRIPPVALATLFILAGASCTTRAGEPGLLDDAALKAYAARPFDKHAMMGQTVELGRNHGLPVVAEFPCSDVCPQYTVRIIHYRLPEGADCAAAGGVEKTVGVPVAIAVMPKTFCVPGALAAGGGYYTRP